MNLSEFITPALCCVFSEASPC